MDKSVKVQFPIMAIDPGTTSSAYIIWDGSKVLDKGYLTNCHMLSRIVKFQHESIMDRSMDAAMGHYKIPVTFPEVYIESIVSYGMPLGQETIDTCVWIGRFHIVANTNLINRKQIKIHHCGTTRAKDKNIRQTLVDKYGPVSTKANPNPVHGGDYKDKMKDHLWSAFALATYVSECVAAGDPINEYILPGSYEEDSTEAR